MYHEDDGRLKGRIKNIVGDKKKINKKILIPIFMIFLKNLYLTIIYIQ